MVKGSGTDLINHTERTELPYRPVKAPRGNSLSCKGWGQEAAMRMLMNNLDEEVG